VLGLKVVEDAIRGLLAYLGRIIRVIGAEAGANH
jgi:hypothetical protein